MVVLVLRREVESLQVGGAGPVQGLAGPPGVEPDQVDGGGCGVVFQAGFGQAEVAGAADAGDVGGLGDGAFYPGADPVFAPPGVAGLLGAGGGGGLVDRAGPEVEGAAAAGGGGALGAGRAGRGGVQELERAPWGQVTCWVSQSMVNMSAVYPPRRACQERSGSSGASRVMPRARAASSRSALAYPVSAACSPGGRPRAASVSWTGSVISASVTGAGVVSVPVIRFGPGRRPAASGVWQVSDRCTLYPPQPVPRLSAYRASRS